MNKFPAYTVVIPTYNASPFIGETIASLTIQTHAPDRIVIVDDGSTDDLAAALAGLDAPISLIRQENAGPGSATSHGVTFVKTPFVAFVDADDIWLPEKIEMQFAALNTPDVDMVFTRMDSFGENTGAANVEDSVAGWGRSTLLTSVTAFNQVGKIEDMPGYRGEMVEWIARARHLGLKLTMLDAKLARRRIHQGSLSWGRDPALDQGYMEVALRALRRRKKAAK